MQKHAMKIVERVLKKKITRYSKPRLITIRIEFEFWQKKRLRDIVNLNELQPGKRTVDALLVLKRMEEEYREKEKSLYKCFVNLEKAFDRVPRKVERATRKKERNNRDDDESGDELV